MPHGGRFHIDFLSGLTVALALIPEAIAFSLVAHVDPLVGLYAAFFMCFITAVFGGRPGMISGATGSMAVVMVALVSQYGIQYLFATVILTGLLQILIGVLRLGKLIRMLPKSVMVGFVNGLALVIFLAQLQQFKVLHANGSRTWLHGEALYLMIGLVLLAMAITHFLPKFTKAVPAALTAIIVVSVIVMVGGLHTRVVSDMMVGHAMMPGLPTFAIPHVPFDFHTASIIVPYAIVLAIIGLSESLMTLSLIDEKTQTHGRSNKECMAQGAANIVSGFFKSMGGCAMIGQSMINISSGGRGRLSGITAGVFLLLFVIVLWPLIKLIPLAALVGVMFIVVIETFEWATFHFIRKIPKHDALIIVTVMAVTVATDLAVAVIVGVIMASLVFAWQTAKNISAKSSVKANGSKVYALHGPLFFGSTTTFKTLFDVVNDPNDVIIDFQYSRVADHSAIDAIQFVANEYTRRGKTLHLRHLSQECRLLLGKAASLVEVNLLEDPDYHVASDALD
ncbi:MAG: sodium-independent anion transporter [Gammaproteobacteria bacterium CG11_big_fil_rev_8_21_14_0_20_46_22]|nr:MAG: sodium-independent anion transporter [Gammaproteobacteria bacterium CG12_big_fil_rev_8_21_14_0_65_46_12]PIR12183.1 MAG: sodium-independent anion transporter [Gammaproteobacteria bacterium CG11_big_fil_rev_8_21_14_0_20_46_22]